MRREDVAKRLNAQLVDPGNLTKGPGAEAAALRRIEKAVLLVGLALGAEEVRTVELVSIDLAEEHPGLVDWVKHRWGRNIGESTGHELTEMSGDVACLRAVMSSAAHPVDALDRAVQLLDEIERRQRGG